MYLFEFLLIFFGRLKLIDNRFGIVLLLPVLDLFVELIVEHIVSGQVDLGESIGLVQWGHPCVLHGAVFGALLKIVVPFLGPRFETLRIRFLNVRSFGDHLREIVA